MQHTATRTATHCNTLQHLQHIATHCNILQHTAAPAVFMGTIGASAEDTTSIVASAAGVAQPLSHVAHL